MLEIDDKLYAKCIALWGYEAQLDMVIEECSELIQAISHLRRKRVGIREVASEIADVELMISQMRHIFKNQDISKLIEEEKEKKIQRIKERLDE